jgi:adenosylcobinamide-phosphate synthase
MVGYKNERYLYFGWASARCDDIVNWLPARITACCLWVSGVILNKTYSLKPVFITLRDAPKHPSPNSGWSEAMVAALLGTQLGGKNSYQGEVSYRALMGDKKRDLHLQDICCTIRYMYAGTVLFLFLISGIYLFIRLI